MEYNALKSRIIEYITLALKEKRLAHTLRVAELAVKMAETHKVNLQSAEIASLLHDMARNITQEELESYVERLNLPDIYRTNINLAHSKIGAFLAEDIFGIKDRDILNAISYHTTGRRCMSLLEKIVFLADAIEPGRNYPGVEDIRNAAETDIDKACLISLRNTIDFVRAKGNYLDKDTIEAFNDIQGEQAMNEQRETAQRIAEALSNKKGTDIVIIDISSKASFADYFVLASGGSERQLEALVESVEDTMEPEGVFPKNVEGKKGSGWILMDYGDVVVNVMTVEMRDRYHIEKIWGDCEVTEVE